MSFLSPDGLPGIGNTQVTSHATAGWIYRCHHFGDNALGPRKYSKLVAFPVSYNLLLLPHSKENPGVPDGALFSRLNYSRFLQPFISGFPRGDHFFCLFLDNATRCCAFRTSL